MWSENYVRTLDPSVIPYDDANEDQVVKLDEILKYEYKDELALADWVYDGHSIDDAPDHGDVRAPLKDMYVLHPYLRFDSLIAYFSLGHWHGYFYEDDGIRATSGVVSMMTFVLEPANGEREFKAKAWSNKGRYKITGSWSIGENDTVDVKFKMIYESVIWIATFFKGRFDAERDALTGVWGLSADMENPGGPMEFRRIQPRYLAVYPTIKELSDNKPRALWGFAIAAVRNDIRRERWSWSYFSQRRDDRKMVLTFVTRYLHFGEPLNDEETQRCCAASQRLTPADACFYASRIDYIRANTWVHESVLNLAHSVSLAYANCRNAFCDSCGGRIGGARLSCLDCVIKGTESHDTVDLCCAKECVAASLTRPDLEAPHDPNHRLVKCRITVLTRQRGRVYTAAEKASTEVEKSCKKIAEASQQPPEKQEGVPDAEAVSSTEDIPSEKPPKDDDKQPDNGTASEEETSGTEGVKDKPQEQEKETPQSAEQVQAPDQDNDLPSCGKCSGPLSFPCWYCIKCEGKLSLVALRILCAVPDNFFRWPFPM